MLSSNVQVFSDPDQYVETVRPASAELTLVGSGRFAARLTRVDLHHLWMQRFTESLPRVMHWNRSDRAAITFQTLPGPAVRWGRMELDPSTLIRLGDAPDGFQRLSGPATFAAMSLPRDRLGALGAVMAGYDITPPRDDMKVTPSAAAMAKLQRLHAASARLADHAPDVIAHPAAAYGLEQALTEAMIECLSGAEPAADSSSQRRHEKIMRKFHMMIEGHSEEAIYIPDLCAAVGVSQRTLNVCCHESLGVSPKRFLLHRRMRLARRSLGQADAATTTITEIAARFGFWNFGRFAVEYRGLFGEGPSATLARTARQYGAAMLAGCK